MYVYRLGRNLDNNIPKLELDANQRVCHSEPCFLCFLSFFLLACFLSSFLSSIPPLFPLPFFVLPSLFLLSFTGAGLEEPKAKSRKTGIEDETGKTQKIDDRLHGQERYQAHAAKRCMRGYHPLEDEVDPGHGHGLAMAQLRMQRSPSHQEQR